MFGSDYSLTVVLPVAPPRFSSHLIELDLELLDKMYNERDGRLPSEVFQAHIWTQYCALVSEGPLSGRAGAAFIALNVKVAVGQRVTNHHAVFIGELIAIRLTLIH